MQRLLIVVVVLLLALNAATAHAITSSVADGGSVVTDLGYNIKLNEGSSLRRSWVVLNDPLSPLQIENVGITTEYGDRQYRYKPVGAAKPKSAVSAFEVRFLLYDLFGRHMMTLSGTEATDLAAGATYSLSEIGAWRAWENDVSSLLTVVAFVAQVRTADGKIWRYSEEGIGEELRRIQLQVTSGVLDPTKDK